MSTYEKLDALYATLPIVECKRKCWNYCGPILIAKIEARRLEEKRGLLETIKTFEAAKEIHLPAPEIAEREMIGLKPDGNLKCVFLNGFGTCTAYSIRPLVCRVWGVVDHPMLRCPNGCKVSPRMLSPIEFKSLLEQIFAIQQEEPRKVG